MTTDQAALTGAYHEGLRHYLHARDESGRNRAYELGHAAIEAGVGLLELVAIHTAAVDELLSGEASHDAFAATMEFFTECLSPFDMAQRGMWEAHARAVQEHRISVELQHSLLPADVPTLPGLEVAVRYLPAGAGEVGGDWYDVIALSGGRVGLVVGDVMGHGIRQAAVMGQLRLGARAYLVEPGALDAAVERVDQLLLNLGEFNTATLLVAVVDPATATLELVNAGHPTPLVVDARGAARYLAAEPGRLLGFEPAPRPVHGPVQLSPGTSLLLYTDGLLAPIERRGEDSMRALLDATQGFVGTADELCDRACDALLKEEPSDDVCLLGARLTQA